MGVLASSFLLGAMVVAFSPGGASGVFVSVFRSLRVSGFFLDFCVGRLAPGPPGMFWRAGVDNPGSFVVFLKVDSCSLQS